MARNLVSPGISFGEIDLSQVAQVTALMGPAFVGTTQSGPAFKPITINNYSSEFVPIFGNLDIAHYVPYATKFYLQYGAYATISRVLGSQNSDNKDEGFVIPASASWVDIIATGDGEATTSTSSGMIPFAVVRERSGTTAPTSLSAECSSAGVWTISAGTDDTVNAVYTFTWDTIESVFTRDPINIPASPACSSLYLDVLYYSQANEGGADSGPSMGDITYHAFNTTTADVLTGTDVDGSYDHAKTPWIIGAPNAAGEVQELMRFHALSDGDESNKDCKISLDNIAQKLDSFGNPYYTFDVLVRKWNDTDKSMTIYERFSGCNLLTNDRNYIVKKIGDTREYYNSGTERMDLTGTWPNKSKFIRVEVNDGIPMGARPSGFNAPPTVKNEITNAYPYRCWKVNHAMGSQLYNKNIFLGFEGNAYGADCLLYGPTTQEQGSDKGFLMFDKSNTNEVTGATGTALSASYHLVPMYDTLTSYKTLSSSSVKAGGFNWKFTVPLNGGMNGYKKSLAGSALVGALSADYEIAINLLENQDLYDFNMLIVPGTIAAQSAHSGIIEQAINMVETRGDAIYVADMFAQTVDNPAAPDNDSIQGFNSSYAATYWPWIKIWDNENESYVWVPPSVLMAAQLAYNDKIAFPWYAPAGINRGQIANAAAARYQVNQEDRDTLYDNRINPIATFRNEGIVVWGQKTLQKEATALDRVNVRRLLVYAKKLIARIGIQLLFEPNNSTTWDRFTNQVNPILAEIAANNGLDDFKVIMNASTNTPDRRDRNEMYGQIMIIPTKAVEALYVDFIVNSSGVEFNN